VEFYIEIGFAVLLRLLKDARRAQYAKAFAKLYNAIGHSFGVASHTDWTPSS
jgi:hypothetical protein